MQAKDKVKVALVGFHEFFCEGFNLFVKKQSSITLVGQAVSTNKIFRLLKTQEPQIALVDASIENSENITVIQSINKSFPQIAIITFCSSCEEYKMLQILEAGAKGILFLNCGKEEILKAIKTVAIKQSYYCPTTAKKLLDLVSRRIVSKKGFQLEFTNREISVIQLICQEYTNKEIADMLSLSMRTIEEYRTGILKKIGAKNAVGVALYAVRNKLVR